MTTLVREFANPVVRCVSVTENRFRPSTFNLIVVSRVYDHPWTLALVNPRVIVPEGTSLEDARQRLLMEKWAMVTVLKNENQGLISFALDCANEVTADPILSIHASGYEEHNGG
jgi:hypothetical protein